MAGRAVIERPYVAPLIVERRNEAGLTQYELAERTKVSRNTINRWERGWNPPTLAKRRKLAAALGGLADDYQWQEHDYERRDRLIQAMIEVRALTRKLLAGEL